MSTNEAAIQQARNVLERYVEAKDLTQPRLMPTLYRPDAVLTYAIDTDEITFPSEVTGIEGITSTLVTDFGTRFDCCKTYYICQRPPAGRDDIDCVPWLVVMREKATAQLRLGKGTYRWQFDRSGDVRLAVRAMHIHIERMAAIPDDDGMLRKAIQQGLPYPWLTPAALQRRVDQLSEGQHSLKFLQPFRVPAGCKE